MDSSYYLPEWEIPKIMRALTGFLVQHDAMHGRLPLTATVALSDDELAQEIGMSCLEFIFVKGDDGKLYYESMVKVETAGVTRPLRLEVCQCQERGRRRP